MAKHFTLRSPALHLVIIAALSYLIYSNTFSVPFHFDDHLNIVDNARIKDIGNFWPPSGVRWFGYLTFALNYRFGGLDPAGYHTVNLVIHILSAFLVYWLVLLTFRTPYFAVLPDPGDRADGRNKLIALFAALLFAAHPVQTQAVTYIVQRLASLAALLYLFSLSAYVQARSLSFAKVPARRNDRGRPLQWLFAVLSLLSAVLAMKTKENAFTLPVVIVLYELFFLGEPVPAAAGRVRRMLYLLPFLLTLLIIPFSRIGSSLNLHAIDSAFTASSDITRHDYFVTEFRVIMTYIRLLFVPAGQSIDYDYPLYRSFFDVPVLLSFLVLACLFGAAVTIAVRSRSSRGPLRLVAFGIFWFFITLSVESSVVPIADIIFEHRLYLPSVGFCIAAAGWLSIIGKQLSVRFRRALTPAFAAAGLSVLVLAVAAHSRNAVWSSEIGLWEDAVAKNPGAVRAVNMVGILYQTNGRMNDAMNAYRRAISLKPSFAEAHVNLGTVYMDKGDLDEAMGEFMTALQLRSLDEVDTANLFTDMGSCYRRKGMTDRAIEFYNYALKVLPDNDTVYALLGRAFIEKGMNGKAAECFQRAHELNPDRY